MPEAAQTTASKDAAQRLSAYLFFANAEISHLITFALESHFDCEVKAFTAAEGVIQALQSAKPHLLVVDGAREEAAVVLESAKGLGCKVAVYHHNSQAPAIQGLDLAGVFNEPELLPGLTAAITQMGFEAKDPSKSNPNFPFFKVGVPLLLRTSPLVSDVFLRLSTLKYVKLFHEGAPFGEDDVKKYRDTKKIEYFYVRHEQAEKLTAKFNQALEELLRQEPLPQSISTAVSIASIDTVHSLVNQVGFTPEVSKLVKNAVELVLKEMYASPSLSSILKNMEMDKEKYIASHSHMLAEVACALSIAMKWDSDTSFKKLTMASILHDMALTNQKLARIKDLNELTAKRAEFSNADLDEYRTHTRRASTLLKGFKEVPADVDKLVLQHHELPIGTGFPEQINHVHIHPLASLIMVGHDLVDWVLDHEGEPDMEAFIEAHADKYKIGNFRKILKALYTLQE